MRNLLAFICGLMLLFAALPLGLIGLLQLVAGIAMPLAWYQGSVLPGAEMAIKWLLFYIAQGGLTAFVAVTFARIGWRLLR